MEDLSIDETKTLGDFNRVRDTVEKWPFDGEGTEKTLFNLHVKNFLLKASYFLFQNWRVVPFIVSISLVLLTYFFTAEITKKRFAGIVAMIVFLQSYTFETFDTVALFLVEKYKDRIMAEKAKIMISCLGLDCPERNGDVNFHTKTPKIILHTANPVGAKRMKNILDGFDIEIKELGFN